MTVIITVVLKVAWTNSVILGCLGLFLTIDFLPLPQVTGHITPTFARLVTITFCAERGTLACPGLRLSRLPSAGLSFVLASGCG